MFLKKLINKKNNNDATASSSSSDNASTLTQKLPIVGPNSIMNRKAHGTSNTPVQDNLRWNCDRKTADRICNFNRHYAEHSGYFLKTTFLHEGRIEANEKQEIIFYDSNTGKPLFRAPRSRTWEEFIKESKNHGWPSFRDDEVVWENVRCLKNGEAVSVDGTHLGHNLPDRNGNRYCINLVSIAGRPTTTKTNTNNDATEEESSSE